MAQKTINVGSGELAGDGESVRNAFIKINENFTEVFELATDASGLAENYNLETNTRIDNLDLSDLSDNNNLLDEEDPVFSASVAASITETNVLEWNTAYGWGNHADAGYIKLYTETDPEFSESPANGITTTDLNNWNAAYSWGNSSIVNNNSVLSVTQAGELEFTINSQTLAKIDLDGILKVNTMQLGSNELAYSSISQTPGVGLEVNTLNNDTVSFSIVKDGVGETLPTLVFLKFNSDGTLTLEDLINEKFTRFINLDELKVAVAESVSFEDFQTKIANL